MAVNHNAPLTLVYALMLSSVAGEGDEHTHAKKKGGINNHLEGAIEAFFFFVPLLHR